MSQDQSSEDHNELVDLGRTVIFGICAPFIVTGVLITDALEALRARLERIDQVLDDE